MPPPQPCVMTFIDARGISPSYDVPYATIGEAEWHLRQHLRENPHSKSEQGKAVGELHTLDKKVKRTYLLLGRTCFTRT